MSVLLTCVEILGLALLVLAAWRVSGTLAIASAGLLLVVAANVAARRGGGDGR